jgi:hypothetical protein
MRGRVLGAVLACALATAAYAQTIEWLTAEPMAIRSTRMEPITLEIQTAGTVSGLRLDLAAGGSATFAPSGPNRWRTTVTAAQALHDYRSDDVNHNFIGFARMLGASSEVLGSYNIFINVVDGSVPAVPVRQLGAGVRATTRVVNFHRSGTPSGDLRPIVQQFYTHFPDDFDFVQVVFTLPIYFANRYHFAVRNDVAGIGLSIFDNSSQYGSAGRLLGLNVFPIDNYFDTGEAAFSHELGHQWVNFSKLQSLQPGPHWPPSTMARGIMGFNIPGSNVGGEFNWNIEPLTATTARTTAGTSTHEFSDFDLYLMGFLPAPQVQPGTVLLGTPCANCIVSSTTVTIGDLIAAQGPRIPDSSVAPRSFRLATIVVSRDRVLNDDEMALLEYFAARGEASQPLPYTSGFARGTTNPFHVATRGIGRVRFAIVEEPPKRRAVRR